MAKVTYTSVKLKINLDVEKFTFNSSEIEVKQYLPINDKYDLINITLQNAFENGVFHPLKMDLYFHLYIVMMYTNITFTEKQKEDEAKLYDILNSSGLMEKILETIPKAEYEELYNYLMECSVQLTNHNRSITTLITSLINDLPTQMAEAAKIVETFDPEQFKAVIDFARAANGGRDIKTNLPVEN